MGLSIEQFQRYFNAKKAGTYKCPVCTTETFVLNAQGTTAGTEMAVHDLVTPDQKMVHQFYSFACTNCGHSTFFHKNQVDQWLKDQSQIDG